jgi:hypothetical protein
LVSFCAIAWSTWSDQIQTKSHVREITHRNETRPDDRAIASNEA